MSRAQGVLICAVGLFFIIVLIWGITTNLAEKRARAEADRDLIENRLKAAGVDPDKRPPPPIPPVVMDEFRKDLRAAMAPPPKGAKGPAPDSGDAIVKARAKAMKALSDRLSDPAPYLEDWQQQLAVEESKVVGKDTSAAQNSAP